MRLHPLRIVQMQPVAREERRQRGERKIGEMLVIDRIEGA